ncbi:MAG TPA: ABC transporter permease subunit, partial [Anaerolineae bacterium]|nr:ABC transporter permease subunit [Anaerolineae bacterium]
LALPATGGQMAISTGLGVVGLVGFVLVTRMGDGLISAENTNTSPLNAFLRGAALLLLFIFTLGNFTDLGSVFGHGLAERLGVFDFVGRFIALIFELLDLMGPSLAGFFGGLTVMALASSYTEEILLRTDERKAKLITTVLAALGAAVLVYGIGSLLTGLYKFDRPEYWTLYPALGAAALAAIGGGLIRPKYPIPIGLIIYTLIRSLLNIIRSIEPLVYVIIFAVWVEIGPFAGILALMLHTVAALGKLFSEQVENISDGPIEAITATGANRIQTIVFAVIPQIVPPYIAFTLYRWDINVRMSTIIGMGGGGGIGFVLAQAINLLRYRQAAVMMIAIAAVVMLLDFVSSRVRQRIL